MPCTCQPVTNKQHVMTLQQVAAPMRQNWRGEAYLIVPVIMAKLGVVMNGATIPDEEFFAPSWNGVPVTFGHPADDNGDFLSANSPEVLDRWQVGYIFGTEYRGGDLKADAYVNIERAEMLREGSIEALETGELKIDVSTGYFCEHDNAQNDITIHRDIKPDHLAILFDIEGACSFEDGCGIRANQQRGKVMPNEQTMNRKSALTTAINAINSAFSTSSKIDANGESEFDKALKVEANRRGADDDFRQMVADLVSMKESPFMPEDMYGLMDMSTETLRVLTQGYKAAAQTVESNGGVSADDPATDPESGANDEEGATMPENKAPAQPEVAQGLSDEDKQALAFARNQYAEHRNSLVARITGNSDMTEDQMKEMDVPTLETIANGIRPTVDYGVRGGNQPLSTQQDESEAESTAAMQIPNVFAMKKEG